jgi:hypothetical protein
MKMKAGEITMAYLAYQWRKWRKAAKIINISVSSKAAMKENIMAKYRSVAQ